jgi:UDP-GlcNAc3NAcA epimerase
MKILTVLGARPQFIKASMLSASFAKIDGFDEIYLHTGQHFDEKMSDIFFNEMNLKAPKYNLNINNLGHGAMTGRMLEEIEKILLIECPDWVVVYGDTNSTLAGALAAKKMHIKVAHIEAGLRSFNINMPEEINRILTDRISDVLFCPTLNACKNLENEGFTSRKSKIVFSGDIMLDSCNHFSTYIKNEQVISGQYILATIHREENTSDIKKLKNLMGIMNKISLRTKLVIPLHPRTKKLIQANNINIEFNVLDPVGYIDMLGLIKNSSLVITDSGGLQKEAFFLKKYCITMREETEWVELVDAGYNVLAPTSDDKILNVVDRLLNKSFITTHNFYGSGNASDLIANELMNFNK